MSWTDRVRSFFPEPPRLQGFSTSYKGCCNECHVFQVVQHVLPDDVAHYVIDFIRPPPPLHEKTCQMCRQHPAFIRLKAWFGFYDSNPLPMKYRGDICTACFPFLQCADFAHVGVGTWIHGYCCAYDEPPYEGHPVAFQDKNMVCVSVDKIVRVHSWYERLTYKVVASGVTRNENWHHDGYEYTVKLLDNYGVVWMRVGHCLDTLVESALGHLRTDKRIDIREKM